MHGTRRYWSGMGLAAALSAGAVLTTRPLLLVGAAMIGASLLAAQFVFVHALARTVEYLTVDAVADEESILTDETTTVTLRVNDLIGAPLWLTIEAQPPVATRVEGERTVALTAEQQRRAAQTSFEVTWPVTGTFGFEPPRVTVGDRYGLFREDVPVEPRTSPTITVEARRPREIQIGSSGRIGPTYGEHEADSIGSGLEPDVLRKYTTEDAASRIDWKTTARMTEPYVREYETDTDRETVLLMDTRACMAEGPPGETKLDYARQVGLALADSAHEYNDPLGLYVVNDEGLTTRMQPTAQRRQYVRVRERIRTLESDAKPDGESTPGRTPAATRRVMAHLSDQSAFAQHLRPYLDDPGTHLQQIDRDPLFRTVQAHIRPLQGSLWTAIITDDTHRAELREAITLARRGNAHVLVFLAPSVLFESGGLSDVGTAYEEYLDFEQFRRQLARMNRVTVFEMGPGDRIDTVLTSGARMYREQTQSTSSPTEAPPHL